MTVSFRFLSSGEVSLQLSSPFLFFASQSSVQTDFDFVCALVNIAIIMKASKKNDRFILLFCFCVSLVLSNFYTLRFANINSGV